jgi:two-component system sensor histidine kinase MprB
VGRLSLRTTVGLVVAAAVALTAGIMGGVLFFSVRQSLYSAVDVSLRARLEAPLYLNNGSKPNGPLVLPANGAPVVLVDGVLTLKGITTVVNPSNETFGVPARPSDLALAKAHAGATLFSDAIGSDGQYLRVLAENVSPGFVVRAMRPLTETQHLLQRLAFLLIGVGFLAVVIGMLFGVLLTRWATQPLTTVAAALRAIGRRETDPDAPYPTMEVTGPTEIREVVVAVSDLQQAVTESRDQQKRLVEDAGHELKTPLASLRANVQFAQVAGGSTGPVGDALSSAVTELDELTRLVEELLQLAKHSQEPSHVETLDVGEIVRNVVDRVSRRSGREVRLDIPKGAAITVAATRNGFESAFGNLLDNAVKFSPEGTPIVAYVRPNSESVEIGVRDSGPGIPEEYRESVFERFHRVPMARGVPGSGLGLAIVAQVASGAGGEAYASVAPEGGAMVAMVLPLAGAGEASHE